VSRKEKVTVQAYNLAGEEVAGDFEGLFARVVQHEIDHLDGRLFIDRIEPLRRADLAGQLQEFEIDFESKRAVGEMPTDEQVAAGEWDADVPRIRRMAADLKVIHFDGSNSDPH
jgi:peptide deformylase